MSLRYAIVVDEVTKRCDVADFEEYTQEQIDYFISKGMTLQDVTKTATDGWYLTEFVPIKPQSEIDQESINELESYLSSTDWYAVRFAETGVEIPQEIKDARASARLEISELRGDNNG